MSRGSVRKRWGTTGRPWYVVCPCIPGKLYRIGPSGQELQEAMMDATSRGWTYEPDRGWSCATCNERRVNDQLDMCLAKEYVPASASQKKERG